MQHLKQDVCILELIWESCNSHSTVAKITYPTHYNTQQNPEEMSGFILDLLL